MKTTTDIGKEGEEEKAQFPCISLYILIIGKKRRCQPSPSASPPIMSSAPQTNQGWGDWFSSGQSLWGVLRSQLSSN